MECSPDRIETLAENEIFVFGSNLSGLHGGGAAAAAYRSFGAEWGVGVGRTGQCYAIPTMQGGVETIRPYVAEFAEYARRHPELTFLVTEIGCGIAGFTPEQIAPLFDLCRDMPNVRLPRRFRRILDDSPSAPSQASPRDVVAVSVAAAVLLVPPALAARSDDFFTREPHCPIYRIAGIPCPACGTTRSIAALWQGDIVAGLLYSPLGVMTAAIAAAVIVVFAVKRISGRDYTRSILLNRRLWIAYAAVAAAAYAVRLVFPAAMPL